MCGYPGLRRAGIDIGDVTDAIEGKIGRTAAYGPCPGLHRLAAGQYRLLIQEPDDGNGR